MISPLEYNLLYKTHQNEFNAVLYTQKVDFMALYLDQSDTILDFTNSLTNQQLSDAGLYTEALPVLDEHLDSYNPVTYEALVGVATVIGVMAFTQTKDYSPTYKYNLNTVEKSVATSMKTTSNDSFSVDEAVWGTDKRDSIYGYTIDMINQGVGRQELIDNLTNHLQKAGQGGAYYKAELVIDTESQRYHFNATRDSINDYNDTREDGTPKLLYSRELSPMHRVKDVCDTVVGVYDTAKLVPSVPSHPGCQCLVRRVFADDYKGKVKTLKSSNGAFFDKKYNQNQPLI